MTLFLQIVYSTSTSSYYKKNVQNYWFQMELNIRLMEVVVIDCIFLSISIILNYSKFILLV